MFYALFVCGYYFVQYGYKSIFYTYYFGKLAFRLSVFLLASLYVFIEFVNVFTAKFVLLIGD